MHAQCPKWRFYHSQPDVLTLKGLGYFHIGYTIVCMADVTTYTWYVIESR